LKQTNGADNLQCNAFINNNAGCGVTEWSHASYGPLFDEANGGVFAMIWDENGIAVCTFVNLAALRDSRSFHPTGSFYRATIPLDITQGEPNPSNWGEPVAALSTQSCNITNYFANHSIVFGEYFDEIHILTHRQCRHHVLW
jgi:hypothetical protein